MQVKRASDSLLGIPSQCFVAAKAGVGQAARGGRTQYTANLAQKINAKLGGCNAQLSMQDKPPFLKDAGSCMIFGADVAHPIGKPLL